MRTLVNFLAVSSAMDFQNWVSLQWQSPSVSVFGIQIINQRCEVSGYERSNVISECRWTAHSQ
jgi:hypothetical protein